MIIYLDCYVNMEINFSTRAHDGYNNTPRYI